MWFYHRAYPYVASDFQADWAKRSATQEAAIEAVKAGTPAPVFPFTVIRDAEGKLIGEVDIFPSGEHAPEEGVWELSYLLHPAYQGRGIARAVVRGAVAWAKAHMGVKRLEAVSSRGW